MKVTFLKDHKADGITTNRKGSTAYLTNEKAAELIDAKIVEEAKRVKQTKTIAKQKAIKRKPIKRKPKQSPRKT